MLLMGLLSGSGRCQPALAPSPWPRGMAGAVSTLMKGAGPAGRVRMQRRGKLFFSFFFSLQLLV